MQFRNLELYFNVYLMFVSVCNFIREHLLKGKAQVLGIENIFLIFNEACYLNEEVNCTELSPSVIVP